MSATAFPRASVVTLDPGARGLPGVLTSAMFQGLAPIAEEFAGDSGDGVLRQPLEGDLATEAPIGDGQAQSRVHEAQALRAQDLFEGDEVLGGGDGQVEHVVRVAVCEPQTELRAAQRVQAVVAPLSVLGRDGGVGLPSEEALEDELSWGPHRDHVALERLHHLVGGQQAQSARRQAYDQELRAGEEVGGETPPRRRRRACG